MAGQSAHDRWFNFPLDDACSQFATIFAGTETPNGPHHPRGANIGLKPISDGNQVKL
jgi:hypothetical protein